MRVVSITLRNITHDVQERCSCSSSAPSSPAVAEMGNGVWRLALRGLDQ